MFQKGAVLSDRQFQGRDKGIPHHQLRRGSICSNTETDGLGPKKEGGNWDESEEKPSLWAAVMSARKRGVNYGRRARRTGGAGPSKKSGATDVREEGHHDGIGTLNTTSSAVFRKGD